MSTSPKKRNGFTLVELLLVIGIIGILLGMATINLVRTQHNASISAVVDQLVSDIHSQQTKAMMGTKDTTGNPNSYGIHVTPSGYVLFQGATDPGDSSDFTVSPQGITFSTNLPNTIAVFSRQSGEIGSGPYTITITNSYGQEQKTITINSFGVVTKVQ